MNQIIKILCVASEIYGSDYPKANITGLSIMVRDIYDVVSKECDVYLYSTRQPLKSNEESATLHTLNSMHECWLKHIKVADAIKSLVHINEGLKSPFRYTKRKAKENLAISRFVKYVKELSPDIVNFHELDDINVRCSDICDHLSIPYLFTNHLYIGGSEGCNAYEYLKKNERHVYNKPNCISSAISTGMRDRILKDYPDLKPKNIYLTLDGTHFEAHDFVKPKQSGRKIFLCIANVMERKNQVQLVRALSQLKVDERKQFVVCFLGSDRTHTLQDAIRDYQCEDVAIYKGKVSSEEMPELYKQAFAVITTTLCEGFGLTIIEGYTYGIPAIIPNDIDSFSDLYNEQSTIAIANRTDDAIIKAIQECMSKEWNSELIKAKAKEFSMDKVGKSYIQMYKKIIADKLYE